jgi:hypothetical protein
VSSGNRQDEYLTDAEIRAWAGCLQFTTAVLRALDEALVAAHRISVKEFEVLITLFNAPGGRLRMTELAERALLTPSGLTHLVTRLEGRLEGRRSASCWDSCVGWPAWATRRCSAGSLASAGSGPSS